MSWEVGISTGIGYRWPIEEVLPEIGRAGFETIEIATASSHIEIDNRDRIVRLQETVRELGLRVYSLHAPFGPGIDFTDPDREVRQRSLQQFRDAAEVLHALRGGLYVIHPGGEDEDWGRERKERLARSVDGLADVWGVCQEHNLTLAVETPLPHLLGGRLADFEWILSRIPRDGVGVCVDTSHTSLGGTLLQSIATFADRLVHVQASDNLGKHDDHLPPGRGCVDWLSTLRALTRAGYRGVFLLEVNAQGDLRESVHDVQVATERLFPAWTQGGSSK